jgi:hypothetical protein
MLIPVVFAKKDKEKVGLFPSFKGPAPQTTYSSGFS